MRNPGLKHPTLRAFLLFFLLTASARAGDVVTSSLSAPEQITAALKSHVRAIHVKDGWIRDPYLTKGPDGCFYLTGTTQPSTLQATPDSDLNAGIGKKSLVGYELRVWKTKDLIHWESLGSPYTVKDGIWSKIHAQRFAKVDESQWRMWAPELHWLGRRWALVDESPSPAGGSDLSLTTGKDIQGPWENPMGPQIKSRHDPSLFQDDDGTWWLIWAATSIEQLKPDFSGFSGDPIQIAPSDRKIGHEGCTILKIDGKYVLFGTAWSTDHLRKGTYNLYYCTADKVTGSYGPRQFVGRFLGHGTPFQTPDGKWWCTAFYNADLPPLPKDGIESKDFSLKAQTINHQGLTLVPLDVKMMDGQLVIRAADPAYGTPGPDEVQKF